MTIRLISNKYDISHWCIDIFTRFYLC